MAGYDARQSTITDGNVGYDVLWNDEYNAILAAFAALTGHKHDGSAGEGGYVNILSDVDAKNKIYVDAATNQIDFYSEVAGVSTLQFSILDGQLLPTATDDVDLGSATKAFKDLYLAGAATLASVTVSGGTINDTTIGATTPSTGRFTTAESIVATGTAPLIVASTTVVTNLNADKLDGQDAPVGTIVGTSDTQTVTNKTINLTNNTLTGTVAEFNTAISDDDFASLTGSQTLTNKSIDLANNTLTGTLAEFNTAVSDDDLAGLGAANVFTQAQDMSAGGAYIGGATADNLLNQYDKNLNWTPVVTVDTPGDLSIVYGVQVGRAQQVGNRVTFNLRLTITTFTYTTATGELHVSLPTPSEATANNYTVCSCVVSEWMAPAGYSTPVAQITNGSSVIDLKRQPNNGGTLGSLDISEIPPTPTSATIIIHVSGTYEV